MLITFSTPTVPTATIAGPMGQAQLLEPGIAAEMTWKRDNQVRLTLRILGEDRPASTKAHEVFIQAILGVDTGATIKTARAIYRGKADYDRQHGLTRIKV